MPWEIPKKICLLAVAVLSLVSNMSKPHLRVWKKAKSLLYVLISRYLKHTYFFFLGFCRVERSPLPRMRRSDCQREPANMEKTIYNTLFLLYIQLFFLYFKQFLLSQLLRRSYHFIVVYKNAIFFSTVALNYFLPIEQCLLFLHIKTILFFAAMAVIRLMVPVPHADDNRIGPCRVQQQRGSRDHQYQ